MTVELGFDFIKLAIEGTVFIGGLVYFVWQMKSQLALLSASHDAIAERLNRMDGDLVKIGEILLTLTRQEERINAHEKRLEAHAQALVTQSDSIQKLLVALSGYSAKIENATVITENINKLRRASK